jgi:hypothetical protein
MSTHLAPPDGNDITLIPEERMARQFRTAHWLGQNRSPNLKLVERSVLTLDDETHDLLAAGALGCRLIERFEICNWLFEVSGL